MSESQMSSPTEMLEEILQFVKKTSGLSSKVDEIGNVHIHQAIDGKTFLFNTEKLSDVLQRVDADGKTFIQVNFASGAKVLFTDTLVGFKPKETFGLDMTKLPKVVTTPDLMSVFEAIEDSLSADNSSVHEIEVLKKVYFSILQGGELAGFDLAYERKWLNRLAPLKIKASA